MDAIRKKNARALFALLLAMLCVLGFHEIAELYHRDGGFRIGYGFDGRGVPVGEINFYAWYTVFGVAAAALLAVAIANTRASALVDAIVDLGCRRPRLVLLIAVGVLLAEILWVQAVVLQGAPIADDESTYAFIAQTLLRGRLVNPSPGDIDFFRNQFIVLNDEVWYGKYPIGQPLFLAVGEVVGLRRLVVPLITCASLPLVWGIGRRIFSPRVAMIGTLLLLISPHFVFTGATELSQPTAMFLMLLAVYAVLRGVESPASSARWMLLAGGALGLAVLVRPLPSLLFIPVLAGYLLFEPGLTWRARIRMWLAGAAPLAAAGIAFLAVNHAQTGSAVSTGVQAFHGGATGLWSGVSGAAVAGSIGGALLRQAFWLFGWPLALVLTGFAGWGRRIGLLWALVIAEYVYRVIAPKTVVASTGPIYVTEIVPLLSLLAAAGAARLVARLKTGGVERARAWIVAWFAASLMIAVVMFVRVEAQNLRRSANTWLAPSRILEEHQIHRALVFANFLTDPDRVETWAYFPPNPSPDLDDDIVFVRWVEDRARNLEFWKRRFPDRRAFVFRWKNGVPLLAPLEAP